MKINLPPKLDAIVNYVIDRKALSISWIAFQSKKVGASGILAVGLVATLYAVFLFVSNEFAPRSSKPTHDLILKKRFSSPTPSENIVIVDIDERSLAQLAPKHGRWPWSRDLLADGIQKIGDAGAKALLFNVMLSDRDLSNPEADAAMEISAAMFEPVAFPLIRLNPGNDSQSQLKISQIEGATSLSTSSPNLTIAAIVPFFSPMQNRLGVANQQPDNDGVVRRYPFVWRENGFTMPSIVKRTVELGGGNVADLPDQIALNWRNKHGRYLRISFSDLLQSPQDDSRLSVIKNAYVVIGLSAPGLGQTKGTSVSPIEDDNEILATALDDVLQNTYLRTMPEWLTLLCNLCAIWGFVWISIRNFDYKHLNKVFLIVQSGLGGITLLSASYTHYLIDLSDCMSFSLTVFGVLKLMQTLEKSWSRAKPGLRRFGSQKAQGQMFIIGYLDSVLKRDQATALRRALDAIVGMQNVVYVDDLFGGESMLKLQCTKYRCQIAIAQESKIDAIHELLQTEKFKQIVTVTRHDLATPWDPDDKLFCDKLAPLVLLNSATALNCA